VNALFNFFDVTYLETIYFNFFITLSSKKQIKTIVSAVESKKELSKTTIPNITNIGRKGGSSVACSIINALMLLYLHKL
jgi:Precorrin-8X methylmutase